MKQKNKFNFKKTNIFLVILSLSILMVGCSSLGKNQKFKYNYNDNAKEFQYDEKLLFTYNKDNSFETIIMPKIENEEKENSFCFIDATIIENNYSEYNDILKYMQSIYTYNLKKNNNFEIQENLNEETIVTIGDYDFHQTNYNYSYIENDNLVEVYSKAIKLNDNQTFVCVFKLTQNMFNEKVVNALNITYDSIKPIIN